MTPRQKPRGRPYNRPIAAAQRFATRLHSSVYRATGGKVGGRLLGSPVLLLTTTGRESGRPRTIPLLYLPDGENLVVVASNGGTAGDPAWWLNLEDDPEANVEVGGRKLRVRAEEAEGEERRRLWEQLVRMYGAYQQYQERTDRRIPVVVLYPVG
jgi:deazaflavin-dependent oxidoreductase (nitroreductase family)